MVPSLTSVGTHFSVGSWPIFLVGVEWREEETLLFLVGEVSFNGGPRSGNYQTGVTGLLCNTLGTKFETEGVMRSPGFSLCSGHRWVDGMVREHRALVLIPPFLPPVPCKGAVARES